MRHGKVQNDADLKLKTGATVNEISTDGTLVGNSDTVVPTEKAIKTYADTKGDVTAGINITDNALVRGDGGVKGIQESTVTISDNGEMTNTSQPAFQVFPSGVQSNIAVNTDVTIIFGSEVFDIGSNFASNTFTAPVTGKYQLSYLITVGQFDTSGGLYEIRLTTSNRTYATFIDPLDFTSDTSPNGHTISFSQLVDMDANDTAFILIRQDSGTAQTDINANSKFSGYLVA